MSDTVKKCTRCGYPLRSDTGDYKVKLDLADPEVRRVFETAQRAAVQVAKWPAWKANECRCPPPSLDLT